MSQAMPAGRAEDSSATVLPPVHGTSFWRGWATLIIAILHLFAAAAVMLGSQLARWFGVPVARRNAIAQMFFIGA